MNFGKAHHKAIDNKTGEVVNAEPMFVKADGLDYQVYEDIQPNGDIQYCIEVTNEYGKKYMKRCPKHLLDQYFGGEIVSDVKLFSDVDMHQPSLQETIARFEGAVKQNDGFYDGELSDDEMDEDDYITEYEERTQLAVERLQELRAQKSKALEGKTQSADKDMSSERSKAAGQSARVGEIVEDVNQSDEAQTAIQ